MRTEVVERRLNSLADLARQGKRINGLHRLLGCPKIWEAAYEAIAPNKGALTPGIDPGNTLDGFSLEGMERIITAVRNGTYRFSPVRRHYIPKANGKKRPLGIPNADDKLVQSAVKLVLERIYEPIFSEDSHGFRPGRSCHTALQQVRRKWTGAVWLVEVDIAGYFDNINHDTLLRLLERRIDDADFLKLIKGMLKAGYMEDWTWQATHSGTPQGGVISPILANVYLHELDEFMAEFASQFNKGRMRRETPEYAKYRCGISNRRRRVEQLRAEDREAEAQQKLQEIREFRAAQVKLQCGDQYDPNYRRLLYIRYADDFLIGVIGTKQEAQDILRQVTAFLKVALKLEISGEKSGITSAKDGATFLGYTVNSYSPGRMRRYEKQGRTVLQRSGARRIQLHAPKAKLDAFAKRHRLGSYYADRGDARPEMAYNSDAEIITYYNSLMRGLAEYYKLGVCWKGELAKLYHIWWWSLVKTLACKHKCSVPYVCNKLLATVEGDMVLWVNGPSGKRMVKVFKLKHIPSSRPVYDDTVDRADPPRLTLGRTDMTERLHARTCESCGTGGVALEIHHARRLADAAHLTLMARLKIARQRKRLALCRPCHLAAHAGTLQARLDQLERM